jgi:hypothetical protein
MLKSKVNTTTVVGKVVGVRPVKVEFISHRQLGTATLPFVKAKELKLKLGDRVEMTTTLQLSKREKKDVEIEFKTAFEIFGVDKKVTS